MNHIFYCCWTNCSVHMDELKKTSPRHVDKRHKEEFVSWFEREVSIILIFCLCNGFAHGTGHFLVPNIIFEIMIIADQHVACTKRNR